MEYETFDYNREIIAWQDAMQDIVYNVESFYDEITGQHRLRVVSERPKVRKDIDEEIYYLCI